MADKQEIEKRKCIWNKKTKRAGLIILISFASFFLAGYVPLWMTDAGLPYEAAHLVNLIFRGIYSFGTIAGVCLFCKSLHDPLTEAEAKELAEKDRKEKTGA